MGRREARATALALLRSVGIPEPERRIRAYPHQLSGGMRQRVTIAIALACGPRLLVADEPTTALDVTIQKQILDLLDHQRRERAMGMVLITHDLGVVAGRTDRVAVMYAGRIVEHGPTRALFHERRHHYTDGLLRCIPRLSNPGHTRLQVVPGRPPDLVDLPPAARSPRGARPPRTAAGRRPDADRRRRRPPARLLLPRRHAGGGGGAGPQPAQGPDGGGGLMAGSGTPPCGSDDILLTVEHLVVEFPVSRAGRVGCPT